MHTFCSQLLTGWGNNYRRRLRVFTLALVIYLDYKAVVKRVQWFSKHHEDALWESAHNRNARRIVKFMIEMKGLWVKLGQYMSTRADILPEAYRCLFVQLQDSLPPRALKEVHRTIERELGKSMKDMFSHFFEAPLATASMAQVHRATLKDGQEVAVKIQHPGIKEIILEDLKNAKSLVEWIAWAEPELDFNRLVDEWHKETIKELDFNIEAENTRKVSMNLGVESEHGCMKLKERVDVLIPEVIQSTEKLLILQYMDGIRLNDMDSLEEFGVNKKKLVREITRAYAHQIYIDGFFNGDPHPGNFLVSKEHPHQPILLDFGLTKSISSSMKQALAKMLLACAEVDHVALLAAFTEMGFKLRVDMPEQAMTVVTLFFANARPENQKSLAEEREKNKQFLKEKNLNEKQKQYFNPVDAFPVDAIIFMRVINLLQGLSRTLNVRIPYLDIMRPFAESTLLGSEPSTTNQWIYNSPVHSDVEAKLRQLLIELGNEKILGVQVCAYKDGKVIIDTAAGVLGRCDPQPVQPDTLFPVFSATKGITAGMVHWLVDKGKLKLDDTITTVWPEFGCNNKDLIKVHHVLNHSSGLHNAMTDFLWSNPLLMCDWGMSLHHTAKAVPETDPGSQQLYHFLSFGWLCGGVIEHASGKKFQDVLEEAIIHPLNIEGELYIGIPPGVESRLASLSLDEEELEKLLQIKCMPEMPFTLQQASLTEVASGLLAFFNTLNVRRATIPAANGHCSARALARFYAVLAAGGSIPPPHSPLSKPLLGSHTHVPQLLPDRSPEKKSNIKDINNSKVPIKKVKNAKTHVDPSTSCDNGSCPFTTKSAQGSLASNDIDNGTSETVRRMFDNPKIHDAIMGTGDYTSMVIPDGDFGLGFRKFNMASGSFGHSGVGGSTGFCDTQHNFSIAVTVNRMSLDGVTRRIIQLVCSELNIPLPQEFSKSGKLGPDMQFNLGNMGQ
ncbi:uncharacterized protein LOC122007137 [Zingiber officinale]|uniref:uncharacterized protein LOC122007137 n=1 Tax=Zingiber officinale TaxID=94328 RepID=UPI001C4DC37F|nr:uncharacterized protein LOC122007137 [Zingiber officinale]